jgi:hypothetical protein
VSYPPQGQPVSMPPSPQGQYYPPPQMPQTNGFATAGLILGILPTGLIGLIFSILGLNRAGKVGGVGRTKSWIGLILSILWMAGGIALGVAVAGDVKKRLDPACISAEGYFSTLEDKMNADQSNPDAVKKDLQDAVTQLNTDAGKTSNAATKAAILKLSGDVQELLSDIDSGTIPSDDLQTRLTTDGNAVDTACGR